MLKVDWTIKNSHCFYSTLPWFCEKTQRLYLLVVSDKKTGTVALICELMDMNIYEFIRGKYEWITCI